MPTPEGHETELRRLRFEPAMEHAFRKEYYRNSLPHTRTVVLAAVGILAFAGLYALQDDAAIRARDWSVRYGVLCPVFAGLFLLTFWRKIRIYQQVVTAAAILFLGTSLLVLDLLLPHSFETQAHLNLIVLLFAAYTLARLRLIYAAAVCCALLLAYNAFALGMLRPPMGIKDLGLRDFFLCVANLLGFISCRAVEEYLRRDFLYKRLLQAEQHRSERLLLSILPRPIAQRLKGDRSVIADSFAEVTVLFADIVSFTPMAATMPAEEVVGLLNRVFSALDRLSEKHGLEKIKTIGDAYMVVGGLPDPRPDHVQAIAEMALEMQAEIARFAAPDGTPLSLRIGINTGPVVAGVIGTKKFIYDLWGDTVNIASRMQTHGVPCGIQVTEATYSRLKHEYVFEERGQIHIRGLSRVPAWLLVGRAGEPPGAPGPMASAPAEAVVADASPASIWGSSA